MKNNYLIMKKLNKFSDFVKMNEELTTIDAKSAIKDIFDKFDGEVTDQYLKDLWKEDSTFRNVYGKADFDKAWEELVEDGTIYNDIGDIWYWEVAGGIKDDVNYDE